MVFQDYALWPHMSVLDNIAYGLTIRKMDRSTIRDRVTELLDLLQLNGLEKRLPPQLSGGQQQRVAIARALATQPALLLLDEPLSNLDMRLRIEMRTEMAYIFRKLGTSVFHVTHDPEEAFAMADRLLIMREGEVDQVGTPQQCYSRPASRWAASLLGAINRMEGTIVHTNVGTGIQCGSTVIYGMTDSKLSTMPEGSPAELMFRPEDLVIASHPGAGMLTNSESQAHLQLKILYSTFEGKRWRSIAHSEAGYKLYLLGDSPLENGAGLTVSLPRAAAFIYPKS
jgi:iron(III) transport system ATP-binding protein/putative spermidine/putrescine transport system ATP-binding protein